MNLREARKKNSLLLDVLFDIVGCFIFSIGIQSFSAPNNMAPGGVSGLSIVLNYLFHLPVSAFSFLLNLPLLLMAWFLIGRPFTLKTLKSVVICTLTLELCSRIIPPYEGEMMLAALYSGVLQGVGIALVFMRGSTTGGTDVASRLIQLKAPHIPVGKVMLGIDVCVLVLSAVVFRSLESALYALVSIYVCSFAIDGILYGLNTGRVVLVLSENHRRIIDGINEELDRGCTILEGRGGYTNANRPVILCAIRKSQYYDLKRIVNDADPNAFMINLEASDIMGEGFVMPGEEVQK